MLPIGCALSSPALQPAGNAVSIAEYRQHLSAIATQIGVLQEHPEQAAGIGAGIPESETVSVDTREFVVHHRDLKDDLATFSTADPAKRAQLLPQIRNHAETLLNEAATYDKSTPDELQARKKLEAILARREFESGQSVGLGDRIKAAIFRWLSRILGRMNFSLGRGFDVVQVVVYGIVLAAVGLLLVWTIRRLTRPDAKIPLREIVPFSPSARGWRAWLADAQSLALHHDWRNAIHLAYWAGIAFLEEHGAWKPNRARTPREYLRLVAVRDPQHPPLAALTRRLETVWYGDRPADEADFRETLGELERLGCR
ncbi:MAG TPA: DUF4129 domain-containing protein [Candidatus Saccharimonadales bacterium]|nr:DUF4129 domain-containing protein [Candidatus Saccharimonadales bacterium]